MSEAKGYIDKVKDMYVFVDIYGPGLRTECCTDKRRGVCVVCVLGIYTQGLKVEISHGER